MAYCTYCGNQNRSGAVFCRFCGETMDVVEEISLPLAPSSNPQVDVVPEPTSRNEPGIPQEAEQTDSNLTDELPLKILPESEPAPTESLLEISPAIDSVDDMESNPETIGLDQEPATDVTVESITTEQADPLNEEVGLQPEKSSPPPIPSAEVEAEEGYVDVNVTQTEPILVDGETQPTNGAPLLSSSDLPLLEILAPGAVLLDRFHVIRDLSAEGEGIEYEAEDWQRCWACHAVQSDTQPKFCEMCGAQMLEKPLVQLTASLQTGEPEQELGGDDFLVGNILYHVTISQPAEKVPTGVVDRLRYASGFHAHPGMVRGNNEDSLLVLELNALSEVKDIPGLGCYAVADGVGGYSAGEVASGEAVRVLSAQVMMEIFCPVMSGEILDRENIKQRLQGAILQANQAIMELRQQQPEHNDMGCTLTMVLMRGNEGLVANVGDSRTYRMRQGKLEQISQDHSIVARMVEQGMIQPQDIYTHEQRNVIYRSLGDRSDVQVDFFDLDLENGDRLLLCSDGLWEMVHDPNLEDVLLERYDAQQACDRMLEMANLAGGEDNISVIVVNAQS